jgi:hypothetical protein
MNVENLAHRFIGEKDPPDGNTARWLRKLGFSGVCRSKGVLSLESVDLFQRSWSIPFGRFFHAR